MATDNEHGPSVEEKKPQPEKLGAAALMGATAGDMSSHSPTAPLILHDVPVHRFPPASSDHLGQIIGVAGL
jgi:hypothetical protein